ncbi:MAG: class I SAM-dependent methyltransferase [Actinobacteria bacterium]|nr:class I SAM-dependent methyltransferase [Actinomycetota bacterium]
MQGYDDATYGEGFADVYDDWYRDISDVRTTVATLAALASGGRVLELGVGTGRLAVPLAAEGLEVHGIDSSPAMLQRLAAKAGGDAVHQTLGDMSGDGPQGLPAGPFALVFIAYNTIFGLPSAERQRDCFHNVAARLASDGLFVVEAFVPDPTHDASPRIAVRSLTVDRVVLGVSAADPSEQKAHGQYIDITETGGVRLRPWSIRWATIEQLDEMAAAAGFVVSERWESFDHAPFGPDSARHVSVYRLLSPRRPPASAR